MSEATVIGPGEQFIISAEAESEAARATVLMPGGWTTTLTVCASEADGAVLVWIDTEYEPDGSGDSPGLRVSVNDDPVFDGKPYHAPAG